MIKITQRNQIECSDWDALVVETYGKPYCFQQQNGCRQRGIFSITIPDEYGNEADEEASYWIPKLEDIMIDDVRDAVKLGAWLSVNPNDYKAKLNQYAHWNVNIFWHRNYYPDIHTIANDLYSKGLIEAGEYDIKIDW